MSFTQENMNAMISNIYTSRNASVQPINDESNCKIYDKLIQLEEKFDSHNSELKEAFMLLASEVLSLRGRIANTTNEIKSIKSELSSTKQCVSYVAHDTLSIFNKIELMELKINLTNSKLSELGTEIESLKKYVILM
jgi:chromosome segregation ATPase